VVYTAFANGVSRRIDAAQQANPACRNPWRNGFAALFDRAMSTVFYPFDIK